MIVSLLVWGRRAASPTTATSADLDHTHGNIPLPAMSVRAGWPRCMWRSTFRRKYVTVLTDCAHLHFMSPVDPCASLCETPREYSVYKPCELQKRKQRTQQSKTTRHVVTHTRRTATSEQSLRGLAPLSVLVSDLSHLSSLWCRDADGTLSLAHKQKHNVTLTVLHTATST